MEVTLFIFFLHMDWLDISSSSVKRWTVFDPICSGSVFGPLVIQLDPDDGVLAVSAGPQLFGPKGGFR